MLIALITMGGLGLVFAAFLATADKFLRVEENPLIAKVNEELPGANCGACGYAGCTAFAEAIVEGKAPVNGCPVGGDDTVKAVAKIMGQDPSSQEKLYPVVMCQGTNNMAYNKLVDYKGPMTCKAADVVSGGQKLCMYGCLGEGDCVEACPFDAMYMNADGLPEVIKELCTGCGVCAQECPRDVIEMHPESHKIFVLCKNKDEGKRARSQCEVVCLGCNACARKSDGGIVMKDNVGVVNYDIVDPEKIEFTKCKTGAVVNLADFEEK